MTTPGSDGTAYVEIVASVQNFERDLERSLKRIAKEQGQSFGERLEKGALAGFNKQLRADLPAYERAGKRMGDALVRGFNGKGVGERIGKNILTGLRSQLKDANVEIGGISTGGVDSGGGGGGGGGGRRSRTGTDQERAENKLRKFLQKEIKERKRADAEAERQHARHLAVFERQIKASQEQQERVQGQIHAERLRRLKEIGVALKTAAAEEKAALKERERVEQEALDRLNKRRLFRGRDDDGGGRGGGFSGGGGGGALNKLSKTLTGFGPGAGVGLKGLAAGLGGVVAITPEIGSLVQALKNMGGALFGLLPAITAAGGLFAIFSGENERLARVVKPVSDLFKEIQVDLDALTAVGAQSGFAVLADEILPRLRIGLQNFATSFGNSISNVFASLNNAGAGESLSRALTSIGQAFESLTGGTGLGQFFALLLRINEQVSAVLPAAFLRLQGFLNGLGVKFGQVDFGVLFEKGVQAVVDLGGAIINLLRVFSAFADAVRGNRPEGTFFATLRRLLDGLVTSINNNRVQIQQFVAAVRSAFAGAVQVVGAFISGFVGGLTSIGGKSDNVATSFQNFAAALVPLASGLGNIIGFLIAAFTALAEVDKATIAVIFAIVGLAGGPVGAVAALVAIIVLFKDEITKLAFQIAGPLTSALSTALDGVSKLLNIASAIPGIGQKFEAAARGARSLADDAKLAEVAVGAAGAALDQQDGRVARAVFEVVTVFTSVRDPNAVGAANAETNTIADEKRRGRDPRRAIGINARQEVEAERRAREARDAINPFKAPKSGSSSSKGGGAGAKAAPSNVDVQQFIEQISDALENALPQGVEETQEAFEQLRRTIRDALKGTAQEARTGAALASLERTRKGALAAAAAYSQITLAVETTTERLSNLRSEQDSFRDSVLETLKASASISTFLQQRPGGGAASFARFLTKDVAKLEKFQADLSSLLKQGLTPALVRDLAAGGLDNARFAGKLAQATPAQISAINALQAKVDALAAGTANLTAATFQAGIDKVNATLQLQLVQQRRQEVQLERLARGIANGIAAVIKGKPLPKFAKGGIATGPSIFGEAGPELAVPLRASQRSRDVERLLAAMARQSGGGSTAGTTIESLSQTFVLPATKSDARSIAREVDRRMAGSVR